MRAISLQHVFLRFSFAVLVVLSLANCPLHSSALAQSTDQSKSPAGVSAPKEQVSGTLDAQRNFKGCFFRPNELDKRLDEMSDAELQTRPYLRFRRVLNHPPRVALSFFILTLIGVVALFVLPQGIAQAKDVCRAKFFGSFAVGLTTSILILVVAKPLLLCEVGFPLAYALIAFWQLGTILGLVVIASVIGEKVGGVLGLKNMPWLAEKPSWRNIVYLVLGALLLAVALAIPNIGHLPRIGTRLVVLIGIVGLGALLKSRSAWAAPLNH
jgi:hypothetical protein